MGTWIAVGLIATAALAVVLVALFQGSPMTRREPERPGWLVPTPGEIRAVRFPLSLQGYDPEHVDVTFSALADAYEELYVAAGPAAIALAQERLEQRRIDGTDAGATDRPTSAGDGASNAEIS